MKVISDKKIILKLSATPELYYDAETENLYVKDVDNTIYRYGDITISVWFAIKGGDYHFLDQITEVMPYKKVSRIPNKMLDSYQLPTPTVVMWKVNSSNLEYVGYDSAEQKLYVQFLTGDVYVYYGVEQEIWNGMKQADSKGSFLHFFLKVNEYRYEKIGGFMLNYSDNYLTPNAGTPHEDGYMVKKNW